MKSFFLSLLGMPAEDFFRYLFFAGLGVLVVMLISAVKRDPSSTSTPFEFSFKFFWSDNFKRIILNILCIFIVLRFGPELLDVEVNEFRALGVGLSLDSILSIIKSRTSLLDTKARK